jgi:K+-transporting ATPase c subunit
MRVTLLCACILMFAHPAIAQQSRGQQVRDDQAVLVGPWTITTTFKGDKFDWRAPRPA